ncbi:MAG: NAD-dependent epimerase/dehydratase family protein, partial [Spirochaetaceae bacterium]|nr:NAD-dependent epimerase/dehydratase family protein [Spirochaetaceae bacterium]
EGLTIRVCRGDIDSGEGLNALLDGCHTLVHAAGLTRALTEDRFRVVNVLGSAKLAAAAALATENAAKAGNSAAHIEHIIAISSLAAVGPSRNDKGVGADDELRPLTPYGRSKVEMEQVMRSIAGPIPCTFLRPPTVYGPRDRDTLELFRMAKRGIRASLNAKSRLSFLYVENLVDAVIACVERPAARGEDFMLADGGAYTWAEFSALIAEAAGRRGIAFTVPGWMLSAAAGISALARPFARKPLLINRDKVLEGRQERWMANTEKTEKTLGFRPRRTTAEGVAATYAWYESQGWL